MTDGPFNTMAKALASRLSGDAGLEGVTIFAESEDIGSKVQAAIQKHAGKGVIIASWTGRIELMPELPRGTADFVVDYAVKPVVQGTTFAIDDIIAKIIRRLHLWEPDGAKLPCYDMVRVGTVVAMETQTAAGTIAIHRVPCRIVIQL